MDLKNIIKLLKKLYFIENNKIYSKKYDDKTLEIDINKEYIAYAEFGIKVGDKTTSNFSSDENFVVLECVDRLLSKGYESQHIELEPKWKLGRGASGGKADILVKDKKDKPLLIIECKTYGKEYEKEINNMYGDGGQLFSYFAQERETKYLCLYASKLNNQIEYKNKIIQTSKEYEKAKNNKELFDVWDKYYLKSFNDNGIFEEDIQAYNIELRAKKRKDLKPLPSDNKIYNQFMEILRHHNISEKERAFNKVISLFLCKIVDETKSENQELDFQYKNGIDDIYSMQDKLLNLFHIGMRDYLEQEITYIKESELEEAFKFYSKKTALNFVIEKFREQKYHSNNEFTFLDVNSKELFFKNAQVLKEVIELFQEYQFSYTHKEQILGNFFENLLSKGFKQSEGQFFTPVPIAKFIMMSLPIEHIIENKQDRGDTFPLPYVMDYACGSAHFLTEAIDEISHISKDLELKNYQNDTSWVKEHIYGIEKDYRLSRTAKVACFLNGAGDTNIIYGDGLEYHPEIPEGRFDIIVANPPYSVKDFKNFSKANAQNFTLFDSLTNSSSEIEVLFLERTHQLLREGGYGAIILPSSILSNSGIYSKARKLLLESFYIKAITELGSNTFGATGTNTVTLFLEKRQNQDNKYFSESAKLLFVNQSKERLDNYDDDSYLECYCEKIAVNYEDYKTLLNGDLNEALKKSEFYQNYKKWFDKLTEIKNLIKKPFFKKLSEEEQRVKLDKELFLKINANEEEKFKYFSLCLYQDNENKQRTTIIKTGEKQVEKDFLGYEWSTRKGSEGIKLYEESKLYDEKNKTNVLKANSHIRKAFLNQVIEIDESLKDNIFRYDLIDLIDFKKIDFDCAISLSIKKNIEIKSKWELVLLGDVCNIKIGGTPSRNHKEYYINATHLWVSISEMKNNIIENTKEKINTLGIQKSNVKLVRKGTTLLSFKLSIGKTAIAGKDLYTNEAIAGLELENEDKLMDRFLFILFNSKFIDLNLLNEDNKAFGKSFNSKFLKEKVKIPLPPIDIQQKIVDEVAVLEKQNQKLKDENIFFKSEIESVFLSIDIFDNLKNVVLKVSDSINPQDNEGMVNYIGLENIESNNASLVGNIEEKYKNIKSTKILFQKNDILYGKLRPNLNKVYLSEFNGICSTDILVFRCKNGELSKFYKYYFLSKKFNDEVLTSISGAQLPRTSWSKIEFIKVPLPSLAKQKEIISKIENLETKITQNNQILENEKQEKNAILTKYL